MIITTTNSFENYKISKYFGVVSTNIVIGTHFFSDLAASFSDFFGGTSETYKRKLDLIYKDATKELEHKAHKLGANCIVGLHIDFDEISGKGKSMFMVSAYGTAAYIKEDQSTVFEYNIPSEFLMNEVRKHDIINNVQNDKWLNEDDWLFIIRNNIHDIATQLLDRYFKALNKNEIDLTSSDRLNISNISQYFQTIDPSISKEVLYRRITSDTNRILDIIKKCNLFDASKLIELINSGHPSIAADLLDVNQYYYSKEDLINMNTIIEHFENIPNVGSIAFTKDGIFSKEKEMYICQNGHKNDVSHDYCSNCGQNRKGLTRDQAEKIQKFKEKHTILASLLE